jgi:hypothetical protein
MVRGDQYAKAINRIISSYSDDDLKAMMTMVMEEENNLAVHINWMKRKWAVLGEVATRLGQPSTARKKTSPSRQSTKMMTMPKAPMSKIEMMAVSLPQSTPPDESEDSSEEPEDVVPSRKTKATKPKSKSPSASPFLTGLMSPAKSRG